MGKEDFVWCEVRIHGGTQENGYQDVKIEHVTGMKDEDDIMWAIKKVKEQENERA